MTIVEKVERMHYFNKHGVQQFKDHVYIVTL
jgi:hypothetical protein